MDADTVILTSAIVTLASTTAAFVLPTSAGGMCSDGKLVATAVGVVNPVAGAALATAGKTCIPSARLIFGTAITFTGLSFLGSVAPQVAAPLAFAIAMTAVTYYGIPLADNVFNGHHNKIGGNPQ